MQLASHAVQISTSAKNLAHWLEKDVNFPKTMLPGYEDDIISLIKLIVNVGSDSDDEFNSTLDAEPPGSFMMTLSPPWPPSKLKKTVDPQDRNHLEPTGTNQVGYDSELILSRPRRGRPPART